MHRHAHRICEVQADSLVRTFPSVRIASIRPHACLHKRPKNPLDDPNTVKYGREVDHFCTANINDLWGWTVSRRLLCQQANQTEAEGCS